MADADGWGVCLAALLGEGDGAEQAGPPFTHRLEPDLIETEDAFVPVGPGPAFTVERQPAWRFEDSALESWEHVRGRRGEGARMPTAVMLAGTDCEHCAEHVASQPHLTLACASVGIEHGKDTVTMLREYIAEYHRRGHRVRKLR